MSGMAPGVHASAAHNSAVLKELPAVATPVPILSFHASRFEARHKTLQGSSNHSFDWHAPYAGRWNREFTAGFGNAICEYRHYSDCLWMDLRRGDPELGGCSCK